MSAFALFASNGFVTLDHAAVREFAPCLRSDLVIRVTLIQLAQTLYAAVNSMTHRAAWRGSAVGLRRAL